MPEVFNHTETRLVLNRLKQIKEDGPVFLSDISLDVDHLVNDELARRYHFDVLGDCTQLDGADVTDVRAYFTRWAERIGGSTDSRDARFTTCILLDEEVLEQLAAVPADYPPLGGPVCESPY